MALQVRTAFFVSARQGEVRSVLLVSQDKLFALTFKILILQLIGMGEGIS